MVWLVVPVAVVAGLCWLSAFAHWAISLGHMSGRTSLFVMLFLGFGAFNPENFTPQGRVYQRRFLYSVAGFGLAVMLGMAVGVVSAMLTH
jgi:hypothetical protein